MTTAHGASAHAAAKPFKSLRYCGLDPLIENQRGKRGVPLIWQGRPGLDQAAAAAMRLAQGAATMARGRRFPREGGRPPIQGQAFSHRLLFSHLPEAGGNRGDRARVSVLLRGAGSGYGDAGR